MKIIGYIILLGLIMAAATGIYYAGKTSERVKHLEAMNSLKQQLESERDDRQMAINSITRLWLEKEPEIDIRYKTIIKRVQDAVPDNSDCDLSADAISLLNAAARNELPKDNNSAKPVN